MINGEAVVHLCGTYTVMFLMSEAIISYLHVQVGIVVGDFELRVKVHSYSNPGSRCAQCSVSIFSSEYSCCDSLTNSGMCAGEDLCDTFFQYCLRPVGSTGISCPNRASTATNYFSPNTDTLVDVGETVFGSENPFRISGPIWTVRSCTQ